MKEDELFFKTILAKIENSKYPCVERNDESEDSYDAKQIKLIDAAIMKHSQEISHHLKRRSLFWQQLNRQPNEN